MDTQLIWNLILTTLLGLLGLLLRTKIEELTKVSDLLTRTREEMARDLLRRQDYIHEFERFEDEIRGTLKRLEVRLDDIMSRRPPQRVTKAN